MSHLHQDALWRKSSRSQDQTLGCCVELAPTGFRKSSRSSDPDMPACVEAGNCCCQQPGMLLRDSKDKRPGAPVLHIGPNAATTFIAAVKAGAYDRIVA